MAQQQYLQSIDPTIMQGALRSAQDYQDYLRQMTLNPETGYMYVDKPMEQRLYNQNGMLFEPIYDMGSGPRTLTGYRGGYWDPSGYGYSNKGKEYGVYDLQGNLVGTDKWDFGESALTKWLPAIVGAALGGVALSVPTAAGEMVNGAFLGENMASGIPAWDMAATNAGLSLTAPAGAIMQNTPLELIPESAMPGPVSGYTGPTFGGVGAGAAGAAGSLLSGIGDKALGIGATVLGGALGSQGTPDQTQEKKMDPRMDQFVYGELMPKVQGLLTSQMPLAQQAGDQMRMVGSGLLGQPIAPNGFERFTRGRY